MESPPGIVVEVDSLFAPVEPVGHQREFTPKPGMKRMSHPKTLLFNVQIGRN